METCSGWTNSGCNTLGCCSYCDTKCVYFNSAVAGHYMEKTGLSTVGYHSIQLKYSIYAGSMESGEYCRVLYSINGNTWTLLHEYGINEGDTKHNGVIDDLGSDADNQSNVRIKFDVVSSTGDNDYCNIDEVYLYGVLTTPNPTPSPTPSPTPGPTPSPTLAPTTPPSLLSTASPTLQPSEYPSDKPTIVPSLNPTLYPSLNPSGNPTLYPSLNPTLFPTYYPTIKPTDIPSTTDNPSMNPTQFPTKLPTSDPTTIPSTTYPSLTPTSDPTFELNIPAYEPTYYKPTTSHTSVGEVTDVLTTYWITNTDNKGIVGDISDNESFWKSNRGIIVGIIMVFIIILFIFLGICLYSKNKKLRKYIKHANNSTGNALKKPLLNADDDEFSSKYIGINKGVSIDTVGYDVANDVIDVDKRRVNELFVFKSNDDDIQGNVVYVGEENDENKDDMLITEEGSQNINNNYDNDINQNHDKTVTRTLTLTRDSISSSDSNDNENTLHTATVK